MIFDIAQKDGPEYLVQVLGGAETFLNARSRRFDVRRRQISTNACAACKRSKTKCTEEKPCPRCIRANAAASCSSWRNGNALPSQPSAEPRPDFSRPPAKKRRTTISESCTRCRQSKLKCSEFKPCTRCVGKGLQDTCTGWRESSKGTESEMAASAYMMTYVRKGRPNPLSLGPPGITLPVSHAGGNTGMHNNVNTSELMALPVDGYSSTLAPKGSIALKVEPWLWATDDDVSTESTYVATDASDIANSPNILDYWSAGPGAEGLCPVYQEIPNCVLFDP